MDEEPPAQKFIDVTSVPPGAAIELDGTSTGQCTPRTIPVITVDDHTVKVTLAGYEPAQQTVTMESVKTASASFNLVPRSKSKWIRLIGIGLFFIVVFILSFLIFGYVFSSGVVPPLPEPILGSWKVVVGGPPGAGLIMIINSNHTVEFLSGSNWEANSIFPNFAVWQKKRSNLYEISRSNGEILSILTYDPKSDTVWLLSESYYNWTRIGN